MEKNRFASEKIHVGVDPRVKEIIDYEKKICNMYLAQVQQKRMVKNAKANHHLVIAL